MSTLRQWGVPNDQMLYLQDAAATRGNVVSRLAELLARTRPGDSLIFYFTGHGVRDKRNGVAYFIPYDSAENYASDLPVDVLVDEIDRNFQGSPVLLLADSCHSGALVEAAKHQHGSRHYLAIGSSTVAGTSTTGWTFTDALIAGFGGEVAADENRDGWVSFEELARFAQGEMVFGDEQIASFGTNDPASAPLRLAPVNGSRFPSRGRHVWVKWAQEWYRARIVDRDSHRYRVHWYSEGAPEPDSWVEADQVRTTAP